MQLQFGLQGERLILETNPLHELFRLESQLAHGIERVMVSFNNPPDVSNVNH